MPLLINGLLALAGAYLGVGVLAAAWLHTRLSRMDAGVRGAGIAFRLLVTPGLVALWPLLVGRARAGAADAFPDPDQPVRSEVLRRRHGTWVRMLAVLVPVMCGLALATRPEARGRAAARGVAGAAVLPRVRSGWIASGNNGEVRHRLRSDRFGWHWQVEVEVAGELPFGDAMLYWMTGREDGGPAQFIGSLAGRGVRRFDVPAELAGRGDFVVVSVSQSRALPRAGG